MTPNMVPNRHKRHLPTVSAEKHMTVDMTHDTSIRHVSSQVSCKKPRNQAEHDTYDASNPITGRKQETEQKMKKRFSGLNARNYWFEDGDNSRDVLVIYAGSKRVGFVEYDFARKFVDQIHDLCDAHETRLREEGAQ